ncbi:MAG: hypothetical protein JWM39_632 [Parcubacteria group bacterium]|nr:hypothetical protein [Parcubacteria group bacterium]
MGLFGKKNKATHILIDVGSASVGGAYVHFKSGQLPTIYYNARINLEQREGEELQTGMLRTLTELTDLLVKEGAPSVHRELGNAHADSIIVSIAAPWQDTRVRVETIQSVRPFTFTKKLLNDTVAKTTHVPEDRIDSGESVIATILNGYEIPNPFGKQVKRAELVILSSTLLKSITEAVEKTLRKAFHTHEISFTGFAPVSYRVFRDLYPHENDYLILDIRGERTDLAFIQTGLLRDVGSIPNGTRALLAIGRKASDITEPPPVLPMGSGLGASYLNPSRNERFSARVEAAEEGWINDLSGLLKDFSTRHALPRTLFLLADDDVRGFLVRTLDTPSLHTLWLSDEPLRIVPVSHAQFTPYVKTFGMATGDIFLDLLALYQTKSAQPVENEPDVIQKPKKLTGKEKKALKERQKEEARAAKEAAALQRPTMGDMVTATSPEDEEPDFSM